MLKLFIFFLLVFFSAYSTAYATGLASVISSFSIPENTPAETIATVSVNVNNPPENIYVFVNNDPHIPGNNSVGDILEISNLYTGKKFIFDSECNTKKLPPLEIRKLLDPSVYEREGRQIINFTFINKCANNKTIDTLYIVSKTKDDDIEPFLTTAIDTDFNPISPSVTPKPIVTPPSGGISLNVPSFKQGTAPYNDNNPIWESDVFAAGDQIQYGCGRTMAQCGCATSSLAMVLKYHKIDKLPNGTEITPGTLNTWLKNNKGYNRNLGVIWPTLGRLAKESRVQNPNFNYDALEYDSNIYFDTNKVTNDLNQGIPNILQVDAPGMHFVVAKGKIGNTFEINDPLFNRTTLASYANQASSVRRYEPSHTDLSYIVYVVDKDAEVTVRDDNGRTYGESYLEYSPAQVIDEPFNTNTSAVKVFYFAKPESDNYTVEVYSSIDPNFQLDEYIFTKEGEMKAASYTGTLTPDAVTSYKLRYDKGNINNIKTELFREVTFALLKNDIKQLYKQKQIKNVIFYTAFLLQTELAEKATLSNKQPLGNKLAVATLKAMQLELNKQKGKSITKEGYDILTSDISTLIKALQENQSGNSGSGSGGS